MANPAELLLRQLETWNTANLRGASAATRRGLDTDLTEALRRHELAMSYISAIRELLDTIDKAGLFPVGDYQRELPAWTQMVLSHPTGWGPPPHPSTLGHGSFNTASLTLLRTLIPQLRQVVPEWSPDQRQQFAAGLDELLATLDADPSINENLAHYLLTLILHMRQVIADYDLRGDFDMTRAYFLLKATVETASEASTDEESKPRWAKLRQVFSWKTAALTAKVATDWHDVWLPLMLGGG